MIPVEFDHPDMNDEASREAVSGLLPGDAVDTSQAEVITAAGEDGTMLSAICYAPEQDAVRILWIETLPEARGEGIGTCLIELLTDELADKEEPPLLTAWFDADEDFDDFAVFLDSTGLFTVAEDELDGEPVRIAVWNGETLTGLEASAEL